MTPERAKQLTRELLDAHYWPEGINSGEVYQRFEDDSPTGFIQVVFGEDGDAHFAVIQDRDPNDFRFSMRFRMPMIGGGESPRVRNALLILAEAIRLDNEDHPQKRNQR